MIDYMPYFFAFGAGYLLAMGLWLISEIKRPSQMNAQAVRTSTDTTSRNVRRKK